MLYEFSHFGRSDYLKLKKGRNLSFPAHLHQCFELIVIRAGEMKVTVDGKTFLLTEHDAILIFPNQIHALESTESEYTLCIFSPQLVRAYFTKISDKLPKNNCFRPSEYLTEALAQLDQASSIIEKKGILYCLCSQFDKAAVYEKKAEKDPALMYRIFDFVEKHFANECSLYDLSKGTGYDYSYLSRYFKKTVGISFNAYVTHFRLSNACYLLENTEAPIVQCAFDSGFSSLRSFNRCFQKELHTTPTQYRKDIHR
ncbi:MAG: helix-turn-helix transcriptional regulator [Oscillospiraceae bacterium]|nr:helix-turn-helix transcriptional regulator [Oscillospiraceae bacterium]